MIIVNTICVLRVAYYAAKAKNIVMAESENNRKKIGVAIRSIRKSKKFSTSDLADAVNTDSGNISRIENGKQGIADKTLNAIARTLGVSVSYIYALAEQNNSTEPETAQMLGYLDELPKYRIAPVVGKIVKTNGVVMIEKLDGSIKKGAISKAENIELYMEDSDEYEPKIQPGMIIVVSPDALFRPERDVLIQFDSEDHRCAVRQYLSEDDENYRVSDINLQGTRERISKSQIMKIERIIGYYQED